MFNRPSLLYCRYYAESDPEDGHRLISLQADQVFGGAEVAFPPYWTGPEVMNSLEQSKSQAFSLVYTRNKNIRRHLYW